jgi:SAM-dependent methyltransferase
MMNWGEQIRWRERVHEQYPEIWDLKIAKKRLPIILQYLKDGQSVLEIGAHNRDLEKRIQKRFPHVIYKSMDIDPTYRHDYASLEEIREGFDMVLLFEVIEHLGLEEGGEMVRQINKILNPGGRAILTTPNIYKPGQYWKDASHRTPYHHAELGGLFLREQFELEEVRRVFSEPFIPFVLKAYLLSFLFRFMGVDFSKSILLVARKVGP